MIRRTAAFLVAALLSFSASAQQPSPIPPPAPAVDALVKLPAADLVSGYLAAKSALPVADLARQGQGILTLGIDGVPYLVNTTNGEQFIALLQQRIATFAKAIEARGSVLMEGQYDLAASPACKGEKFDPRYAFATRGTGGTPVMASRGQVVLNGIEADLLVTVIQGRASVGVILVGAAVDDAVIFANVMGEGFNLYGTIKGNAIALRFEPDEVKAALGAGAGTDADWNNLADCVFTLTKR
jgi:hypothetical protein